MGIMLGNLSIKQMEERLGIKLTAEDVKNMWGHSSLAKLQSKDDWHCFDIPFFISCGSMETAIRIRDVLAPYSDKMSCQIQIGIDEVKCERI